MTATIGTVRFDITSNNEAFAQSLYARWDAFFYTSFEAVVEEVLSHYNRKDEVLTIHQLPIDIGILSEEKFDNQFPVRLREILHQYFRKILAADNETVSAIGANRISLAQSTLEILCFFLLHGYLPANADHNQMDIGVLLQQVLQTSPDQFRAFLESYAHYDFLYKRLVYQFDDEQLEAIVNGIHPSESKFINLYVRVQIHSYKKSQVSEIGFTDYRNAIWILVLAYLCSEGGSRFNRKQLVLHTLRGLSARYNLSFEELTRILTEELAELEKSTVGLPELWGILKEIRQDIHAELLVLNSSYLKTAYREIVDALRITAHEEPSYLLTKENLAVILSVPESCRELLRQLREDEIHHLVELVLPQESAFVISYAQLLDLHKERGYFVGKVGNDFRLVKWEFIFAVIFNAPLATFSRLQFVLKATEKIAAHYNLSISEVIHFLLNEDELHHIFSSLNLLPVLLELRQVLAPPAITHEVAAAGPVTINSPLEELVAVLSVTLSARKFLARHSDVDIYKVVQRIIPSQSTFIRTYAELLEKEATKGLLEGKSGTDFRILKWEFIFSCLPTTAGTTSFNRKYFVYHVLKQLAAHYNQDIMELLTYFYQEFTTVGTPSVYTELAHTLSELYRESLLPLADTTVVKGMHKETITQWMIQLFGHTAPIAQHDKYIEKWLVYSLEEQNNIFISLWKSGQLNEALLFSVIQRNDKLSHLWMRRIGDARLLEVYRIWLHKFSILSKNIPELHVLQSVVSYLVQWIVQLTSKQYASWSAGEIEHFLVQRTRHSLPSGTLPIFDTLYSKSTHTPIHEVIQTFKTNNMDNQLSTDPNEAVQVTNAGLVILYPFFNRFFSILDLVDPSSNMQLKDEESQLKAIFLLQYLAHGDKTREYKEHELMLNKLIVGWNNTTPLPTKINFSEKEIEVADNLLESAKLHWDKIRHTSLQGIRESFFNRKGVLKRVEDELRYLLEVEQKAYDVLLDSIPWSYNYIRTYNTDFLIQVKWR